MQWNNDFIEPYTELTFIESTLISAKNLNNLGNQYLSGKYLVDNHNHGDVYYTETEADAKYFYDGHTTGSDADMVDGEHFSDLSGAALPKYSVIAWESSTIPAGYALCNGQTVDGVITPDLRDYFVAAAGDDYTLNQTFGDNTFSLTGDITVNSHTLTVDELPVHRHEFYDYYFGGSNLLLRDPKGYSTRSFPTGYTSKTSQNTSEVGGGQGHNHTGSITFDQINSDNRPKYYAIYFIMKVV